jgi:histidine kinase
MEDNRAIPFRETHVIDGSTGTPGLYTIRKAVQKLAEETDGKALLKTFLEIAIEHAGADKGYLIMERTGKLFIEVAKESAMHTTMVLTPLPLEKSANLSQAMVQDVVRTMEPVVLNDAEQADNFTGDPYLAPACAKSTVCLPLLFRGMLVGVLYLENSLLTGVFTPDRLEVLKILAIHMACIRKLHAYLEEDTVGAKDEKPSPLIERITERITERELEVLSLIAAGMTNQEIAQKLKLTMSTVKTHILNIYGKLRVNRRVQAVSRAKELRLLKIK